MLEHVAGGYAYRASREAAEACERLFERPVERGLSQAGLETLSIVAYLGPCSRPEIARIRGVAADSAVAGLLERGLIAEAGRDDGPGGAVRYRTTPLFERVFGLESAAALPRLDDLGETADGDSRAPPLGRRRKNGLTSLRLEICHAPAAQHGDPVAVARDPVDVELVLADHEVDVDVAAFARIRSASSSSGKVYALPSAMWLAAFSSSSVS